MTQPWWPLSVPDSHHRWPSNDLQSARYLSTFPRFVRFYLNYQIYMCEHFTNQKTYDAQLKKYYQKILSWNKTFLPTQRTSNVVYRSLCSWFCTNTRNRARFTFYFQQVGNVARCSIPRDFPSRISYFTYRLNSATCKTRRRAGSELRASINLINYH